MPEVSKWQFVNARNFVNCPKCGAEVGERCRQPKGRSTYTPHVKRLVELRIKYPDVSRYSRSDVTIKPAVPF